MLRLVAFGGLTLADNGVEKSQPPRRLALFARLAVAGGGGVSRDELLALFWSERDLETARHSLDQLLYESRRSRGAAPVVGTSMLRLDPEAVGSDVAEWSFAIEREDFERAVALYRGPFLNGFYLRGTSEFERWVESTRARFADEYRRALESLAGKASAEDRLGDAVSWWRRLVADDPLSSRTALGLMRALVHAGDHGGAIDFARVHERLIQTELEVSPDPAVAAYAESLRAHLPAALAETVSRSRPVSNADDREAAAEPVAAPAQPDGVPRRRRGLYLAGAAPLLAAAAIAMIELRFRQKQPSTTRRSPDLATSSIAAHDEYMIGRDPTLLRSDSTLRVAIEHLRRATELDSNYAAAFATLASRYATAVYGLSIPKSERGAMHAKALAAAQRAVALDDSLADAHAELGYALAVGLNPTAGLVEMERAAALDPKLSVNRQFLIRTYEYVGRAADALSEARLAVQDEPLSPNLRAELGEALYFARRYDDALIELKKVSDVRPQLRRVPEYFADVYGAMGRWSEMISVLRPAVLHEPAARGRLALALGRSGATAQARQVLNAMLADADDGTTPAAPIAEAYLGLGLNDSAFVWLDRAFGDFSLRAGIMGPLFDSLHADPRFEQVKRRLGLIP